MTRLNRVLRSDAVGNGSLPSSAVTNINPTYILCRDNYNYTFRTQKPNIHTV